MQRILQSRAGAQLETVTLSAMISGNQQRTFRE